jgi:triphosphatase
VPTPDLDLELPPDEAAHLARLPALARHRSGRARTVPVTLVWHDAPDGALAGAGLVLCERRSGRARSWRIMALHADLPGTPARVLREDDDPAALGHPLPAGLVAVAACTGRLRTLPIDPASAGVAGVSVLEGRLRAVTGEYPICRVGLHGVTDPAMALALAGEVRLTAARVTLAAQALRVAGRAVPDPDPPALAPSQSVSEAFAALLARQAGVLLRLAPQAAARNGSEPVHQMRVALRRLRSALKLFRSAVDCPALQALKPELKELGRHLGPARDWDVFVAGTGPAVARAFPEDKAITNLLDAAVRKQAESYAALAAYLHGPAFRLLGIRLAWLAAARPWEALPIADEAQGAALTQPLTEFAARQLTRRHARLLAPGADLSGLSPEALHAVRIEAKRLRYAAEFFAPLYPPRPVRRFVRRVTALQDRLGQLNDGTVAAELMAALDDAPERSYATGVVRGFVAGSHQNATRKVARAWRRVRRLESFWD